jgi:hypothetical protein
MNSLFQKQSVKLFLWFLKIKSDFTELCYFLYLQMYFFLGGGVCCTAVWAHFPGRRAKYTHWQVYLHRAKWSLLRTSWLTARKICQKVSLVNSLQFKNTLNYISSNTFGKFNNWTYVLTTFQKIGNFLLKLCRWGVWSYWTLKKIHNQDSNHWATWIQKKNTYLFKAPSRAAATSLYFFLAFVNTI